MDAEITTEIIDQQLKDWEAQYGDWRKASIEAFDFTAGQQWSGRRRGGLRADGRMGRHRLT